MASEAQRRKINNVINQLGEFDVDLPAGLGKINIFEEMKELNLFLISAEKIETRDLILNDKQINGLWIDEWAFEHRSESVIAGLIVEEVILLAAKKIAQKQGEKWEQELIEEVYKVAFIYRERTEARLSRAENLSYTAGILTIIVGIGALFFGALTGIVPEILGVNPAFVFLLSLVLGLHFLRGADLGKKEFKGIPKILGKMATSHIPYLIVGIMIFTGILVSWFPPLVEFFYYSFEHVIDLHIYFPLFLQIMAGFTTLSLAVMFASTFWGIGLDKYMMGKKDKVKEPTGLWGKMIRKVEEEWNMFGGSKTPLGVISSIGLVFGIVFAFSLPNIIATAIAGNIIYSLGLIYLLPITMILFWYPAYFLSSNLQIWSFNIDDIRVNRKFYISQVRTLEEVGKTKEELATVTISIPIFGEPTKTVIKQTVDLIQTQQIE